MKREPYSEDIDIALIDEGQNLSREYYGDLKALASAIKENDWLAPLQVVKNGKRYTLAAGYRRKRAVQLLIDAGDWDRKIPCQVFLTLTDAAAAALNVAENEERLAPNPVERMRSYQKLVERHGHSPKTLAARFGKSVQTVNNYLRMGKQLHPVILKAVANSGEVELLPVPTLLRLCAKTPDQQLAWWEARSAHKQSRQDNDDAPELVSDEKRMRRRREILAAIKTLKSIGDDETAFGAKVLQWALGERSEPWED